MNFSIGRQEASPRKPAVLQVVPALVTGGVERGTVELSAALVAAGWRSIVASSGGPLVYEIERAGGKHVMLPLASKNPWVIRANIARLAELVEREDIHIVHARSRAPAWSAFYAARQTGRHFVTTFHNAYGSAVAVKRWYNSVMAKGERVIAISHFVADHVAATYGVGDDRLRVIHRGADLQRFNPELVHPERVIRLAREWRLPDGAPIIMLPGRPTRWKGHMELIRAVATLRHPDLRCLLVGADEAKGRYRDHLMAEIKRHELGGVFHLLPDCRDMPAAYMLADVVVSASTRPEGFGRVAVEAQAMGRPVIATDHGGARETVRSGETGWLVPPGDVAALAASLNRVLGLTEAERVALGHRSIDHIRENFSKDLMTGRTLTVYAELLFPDAVTGVGEAAA